MSKMYESDKEKREATHVTIDFIVNNKINFNEH